MVSTLPEATGNSKSSLNSSICRNLSAPICSVQNLSGVFLVHFCTVLGAGLLLFFMKPFDQCLSVWICLSWLQDSCRVQSVRLHTPTSHTTPIHLLISWRPQNHENWRISLIGTIYCEIIIVIVLSTVPGNIIAKLRSKGISRWWVRVKSSRIFL